VSKGGSRRPYFLPRGTSRNAANGQSALVSTHQATIACVVPTIRSSSGTAIGEIIRNSSCVSWTEAGRIWRWSPPRPGSLWCWSSPGRPAQVDGCRGRGRAPAGPPVSTPFGPPASPASPRLAPPVAERWLSDNVLPKSPVEDSDRHSAQAANATAPVQQDPGNARPYSARTAG
jgi:hypothetical protein